MTDSAVARNVPGPELPAPIGGAGGGAALRLLEFFAVNIRNRRARAAYARAAGRSNAKTTGQCDRRNDDVCVGEVKRIGT